MVRLAISVEGQTEEAFVKTVLAPHLAKHEVFATPVTIATSRDATGRKAKGGGVNVDRVVSEVGRLLATHQDGYVSSLYDYYGFKGRQDGETVEQLEKRIAERLRNPSNLICYVQLHEFEGLLLSDAQVVAHYFQVPELARLIDSALAAVDSPEQVNDSPETAPSKRLEKWTASAAPALLRYSKKTKVRHGTVLAQRLTLETIRANCPRFNDWVQRLEGLPGRTIPS